MPVNKISRQRQQEIVDVINTIRIDTGMSYPENGLKSIITHAVPDILIKEDNFNGNKHIKGAVFRQSPEYEHPLIAIQADQPRYAKTFALAHEFGHFMLQHNPHSNYLIDTREYDGSKTMQDEGEATFFAMSLLMPKEEFSRLDLPFVDDRQLSRYFGVTDAQVRVRREWLKTNGF